MSKYFEALFAANKYVKAKAADLAGAVDKHGESLAQATGKLAATAAAKVGGHVKQAAKVIQEHSEDAGNSLRGDTLFTQSLRKLMGATTTTGAALKLSGEQLSAYAEHVGAATEKAGQGAVATVVGGLGYVAISKADLQSLRNDLHDQGEEIHRRSTELTKLADRADQQKRPRKFYDTVTVAGISLAEMIRFPGRIPDEVHEAYQLAYPRLAAEIDFVSAAQRLSPTEVVGLTNGVKGKLFELQYTEHLNSGGLPDGYQAGLSESATTPGWDIAITGTDGELLELLQAKATASASYVRQAIDRYPDIDVVTTEEVYAQLLAAGFAEGVRNSGVLLSELDQVVIGGADLAQQGVDWTDVAPMGFGLALIAGSLILDKELSSMRKAEELGSRSARLVAAGIIAKATLAVSQLWIVALVVGAGSHFVAPQGQVKLREYSILKRQRDILRKAKTQRATGAHA